MRYYVVWTGRKTGIFDNWPECERAVKYFSGAKFKSFDTLIEAEKAYHTKQCTNQVLKGYDTNVVEQFSGGVVVDAACSGNGKENCTTWWRGVENGSVVFNGGPIRGTNNIGEFLAICDGLRLSDKNIYSDSTIAIKWAVNKSFKTKYTAPPEVRRLLESAVEWLQTHNFKGRIFFWNNKQWGENPADYGRK